AGEYAHAGLEAPFQQWYLKPATPASWPDELVIEERFEGEAWHFALRWRDPSGRSRLDRTSRPGWLGLTPARGTNLMRFPNQSAPRLMAEVTGDFVAETRVELEPGSFVH